MSSADLYRKIKSLGGIADLSARAQIHLTGADRVRYLNGQVSNDVHKLNPRHAMPAWGLTVAWGSVPASSTPRLTPPLRSNARADAG